MNQVLNPQTLVLLHVNFREQSGSTRPVRLIKTVQDLGVTLPDGTAKLPSDQEVQDAIATDKQDKYALAVNALFARYAAMNADVGNPIVSLRRALTELLSQGKLEDHKVDAVDYRWEGDELGLSAQWRTDDAQGTITGIPNVEYLAFTGAAVWGSEWETDFWNKINQAGGPNAIKANVDPFAAVERDTLNDFERDEIEEDERNEDALARNEEGVLTLHLPAGIKLVRIFIEE